MIVSTSNANKKVVLGIIVIEISSKSTCHETAYSHLVLPELVVDLGGPIRRLELSNGAAML